MSDVYRQGVRGRVWYQGGYTGWGTGRAIPGYYPATAKRSPDSEAGPGSPGTGLEWVVWVQRPLRLLDHPLRCAPGPAPLSRTLPTGCRLLANNGEISVNI